tara:strand:+ start:236 stop:874 length:639 start_codon:yes stop_codon:yes gene_type:complete
LEGLINMEKLISQIHRKRLKNSKTFDNFVLKEFKKIMKKKEVKQNNISKKLNLLVEINEKYESYNIMHPIRIAYYSNLFFKINIDLINLGLFHNFYEIKNINKKKYDKFLGKKLSDRIKILTVKKENKFNSKYINKFYKKLNLTSNIVKKIKCLDKFDNLYNLKKNPDKKVKIKYLEEIVEFVLPIVKEQSYILFRYFVLLVNYNKKLLKKI